MTLCFTMLQHLIKTSLNHLFNVDQGKMLLDIIEEQQWIFHLKIILILFKYFLRYTRDIDEVIRRSNATHYGLAAGVFTKNVHTANTLMRALRVGTVWINCFDVFDAAIPFGGYKMSGIGREKGIYSLNNYLQVKAVVSPVKKPAWLWFVNCSNCYDRNPTWLSSFSAEAMACNK